MARVRGQAQITVRGSRREGTRSSDARVTLFVRGRRDGVDAEGGWCSQVTIRISSFVQQTVRAPHAATSQLGLQLEGWLVFASYGIDARVEVSLMYD